MSLEDTYPALSDLARRARRRLPRFVWDFLDSGTGNETATRANPQALDRIALTPGILRGLPTPELEVDLMGTRYALPFGISGGDVGADLAGGRGDAGPRRRGRAHSLWPVDRRRLHARRDRAVHRRDGLVPVVSAEGARDADAIGHFES